MPQLYVFSKRCVMTVPRALQHNPRHSLLQNPLGTYGWFLGERT